MDVAVLQVHHKNKSTGERITTTVDVEPLSAEGWDCATHMATLINRHANTRHHS